MALSRVTTVGDIIALSEQQLGDYMKAHHLANGSIELQIDGWDRLSDLERDLLAQRLQSIRREAVDSPTAGSGPLDLDKLDELLRGVLSNKDDDSPTQDRSSISQRERRTETPPDEHGKYIQDEMAAYHKLVNDGGHPLYPISLLESVSKDPDASYEVLKPFWRQPRNDYLQEMDHFEVRGIFQRQWYRWQNFRKWQLDNRHVKEDDDGFLAYVEKVKHRRREIGDLSGLEEIETDPTCLKQPGRGWYYVQQHRNWQRKHQREPGCESFSDYEKAIKARLAQHEFTRPFRLAESPSHQDRLTTWIEYLGFEFWWLDRYHSAIARLQPGQDQAWNELESLQILKGDETREFICTDESGLRCQTEVDCAAKALEKAEAKAEAVYHKTQSSPSRLNIPRQQQHIEMLAETQNMLDAARGALDSAKKRSRLLDVFVRGTHEYDRAREDAECQRNLLDWAVQESFSIAAEQESANTKRASRRNKKSAAFADDCSLLSSSRCKRRKSSPRGHGTTPCHEQVDSTSRGKLRLGGQATTTSSPQLHQGQGQEQGTQGTEPRSQPPVPNMPQGLRRSSRLAALTQSASSSRRTKSSSNLGSDFLSMDKLLAKRTRKRGRGHDTVEYLVKFKGRHDSPDLWIAAKNLPKTAKDAFARLSGD